MYMWHIVTRYCKLRGVNNLANKADPCRTAHTTFGRKHHHSCSSNQRRGHMKPIKKEGLTVGILGGIGLGLLLGSEYHSSTITLIGAACVIIALLL